MDVGFDIIDNLVFILGIGVLMIEFSNLMLCCISSNDRSKARVSRVNEWISGINIGLYSAAVTTRPKSPQ
jgi:hypothetical protein